MSEDLDKFLFEIVDSPRIKRLVPEALRGEFAAELKAIADAIGSASGDPVPEPAVTQPQLARDATTTFDGRPKHVLPDGTPVTLAAPTPHGVHGFEPNLEPVYVVAADGSCSGNPGPGGWGVAFEDGTELAGRKGQTTNNEMELTAAIIALAAAPEGARVRLICDSNYVLDGLKKYLPGWKARGWRKADGKPVKNRDLWAMLDVLASSRRVDPQWVKGHDGHPLNERANTLAQTETAAMVASW